MAHMLKEESLTEASISSGRSEGGMRWTSAISERVIIDEAVSEVCKEVRESLGDTPDLVAIFVSSHFSPEYEAVPPLVHKSLSPRTLIGSSGSGIIGDGKEAEHRPAVSMLAGILPAVELKSFRLAPEEIPELDVAPSNWRRRLGLAADQIPHFLLLANPYDCPVDQLIEALDQAFPGSAKFGGLASGTSSPESFCLFEGRGATRAGAVGVAMSGQVEVDTIVAQGCRPVGKPGVVTKAAGTLLVEVDGKPSLQGLLEIYESLDEENRQLFQRSLHCGISQEGGAHEGEAYHGSFLIRNVMGIDREAQTVQVGHSLKEGIAVQWHVRDAGTAREELERMLDEYADGQGRATAAPTGQRPEAATRESSSSSPAPQGVFLFSCSGRGTHMFGVEGHDSGMIRRRLGELPLAGFFCNGEIGKVGEVTYLHGFTSSIAVVRPKQPRPDLGHKTA